MSEALLPIPERLVVELRFFSFYLGNGTIDLEILPFEDGDYRTHLMQYGSDLEQIYALFLRNINLDSHGEVYNSAYAQRRVAQWIRHLIDPTYVVEPPFTPQELDLGGP